MSTTIKPFYGRDLDYAVELSIRFLMPVLLLISRTATSVLFLFYFHFFYHYFPAIRWHVFTMFEWIPKLIPRKCIGCL